MRAGSRQRDKRGATLQQPELRQLAQHALRHVARAAALAGLMTTSLTLPGELPLWLIAVAVGAALGSWLGARYLPPRVLRYVLAALLLVGGGWMIAGGS